MDAKSFLRNKLHLILIILVFLAFVVYYLDNIYNNVGYFPDQPIVYSHKIHAGDYRIECLYCHTAAEKGPHATVPSLERCMGCHSVVAIDKEDVQTMKSIYDEGKAIEWVRVHSLPDHAYFNHKWHVNAGIECETCHGEVSEMAVIGQVNRLEMGDCLICHRDNDYSLPYFEKVAALNAGDIANIVYRYPYLKYIDDWTLRTMQEAGIQYIKDESELPEKQATGVDVQHNAPQQCNTCHN